MRTLIFATALAVSAVSAQAASPFDGHWVDDLQTQMGQAGYDDYLVANGYYTCKSCSPPCHYPADGKMRRVPSDVSVISEGVTITGPRTMVTHITDHEMSRETTMTVAPDNRTAIYVSVDKWPNYPKLLRTEYVARRIAPAPPGAHLLSGRWLGLKYLEGPEEYRSNDFKEGDGLFTRSNFRHGHYTAKIGGPAAPVTGDGKNIFMALVRAPDARTRIETISLNGKTLVERTYHLLPGSRSMLTTVRDPKNGSIYKITSRRRR
jgi:hypothetical protein